MTTNVAVVGAGVIGLSTAINVQMTIPGARVTLIADKFYEGTTSYGSGGMFIPSITSLPNESIEDLR
jgi:glycine/D-amino acid oxidase-like deaminating enzyme